jgi:glutamate-1-semialdehyde 2,1-aminomutase
LPVGAYGGKREIMEMIAPSGPIYQAGTLSGNPLAMAAGYTTLKLMTHERYQLLERQAVKLQLGFEKNAAKHGIASTINRVGSMVCPFFTEQTVINYDSAKTSDLARFRTYFAAMLDQGVSIAPSQFEGMFVSGVHSDEDIEATIAAHDAAFARL